MKLKVEVSLEGLLERQAEVLRGFEALLVDRAVPLGLVAEGDQERIWDRHIVDSLRARSCLEPGDETIVDVGSGAGLPGITLAIAEPRRQLVLVEPRRSRAAFLELVVDELGLSNVEVLAIPAQRVRKTAPLCTARAVGSLERTWAMAGPLVSERGRLLYFAGASWEPPASQEWADSGASWEISSPGVFPWQGPLVIIRRSHV